MGYSKEADKERRRALREQYMATAQKLKAAREFDQARLPKPTTTTWLTYAMWAVLGAAVVDTLWHAFKLYRRISSKEEDLEE